MRSFIIDAGADAEARSLIVQKEIRSATEFAAAGQALTETAAERRPIVRQPAMIATMNAAAKKPLMTEPPRGGMEWLQEKEPGFWI